MITHIDDELKKASGKRLFFDEPTHKYWWGTPDGGIDLISATTFIGLFKPKFDSEYWVPYTALKYLLGYDKRTFSVFLNTVPFNKANKHKDEIYKLAKHLKINLDDLKAKEEEVKILWKGKSDQANARGTRYHNKQEQKQYRDGGVNYDSTFTKIIHHTGGYLNLSPDVGINSCPEMRLINLEYGIAGTSDDVFFLPNNIVDINDWKGLALDTPLPTPTGWTTIRDVKKGDVLFDGDGNVTNVLNVSEIHNNPCYEIKFDTNDILIADHEHRWVVEYRDKGNRLKEAEVTTEELLKLKESTTVRIKTTYINLPKADLPIDPYVLGLWLGDGNRCAGTICEPREEIWDEIIRRGYEVGEDISAEDRAKTKTIFGLEKELRLLNLIKNKHIPILYLRASYEQRLDLLRGFMDADGHYHRKRNRCVMETTKDWQRDAIVELTSSLGMKPAVFKEKSTGFGKEFESYHVCFSPDENPFLIRNKDYERGKGDRHLYRNIKSVTLIPTVETKCLEVDSPTHTYLAGKTFIKTHNTNQQIDTENKWQKMRGPLWHLDDCNQNHYFIQLSLYAWMLEQYGYKPRILKFTHVKLNEDEEEIMRTEYHTPYLKKEVEGMLKHYKKYGANF